MARTGIYDYSRPAHAHPDEPVTPRAAGWFDPDKAERFEEATGGRDGQMSLATEKMGHHQELYRTRGGKWVLCSWSQYHDTMARYEYVPPDVARDWLIRSQHQDAVERYFTGLPEEGTTVGRPSVGPKREVRLSPERWAQVDAYAQERGLEKAAALREIIERGLDAID
ncbi:hypothetical protein [Streptomyces aidingensis]|uniref:Uncharacterized protein n=1 Tax=Streptomyces aidingensis TaxID=910347 RepID=A0A1I1Q943_9ACTN|nr:hypothetical protein [Streptomyces aidingensis]SFD14640.1 hypothetical protein SAMN05421773_110132 [Streptomyces aidingensis]